MKTQSELKKAICDALGLKKVISLKIKFEIGSPITVEAVQLLKEGDKLISVLNEYVLTDKKRSWKSLFINKNTGMVHTGSIKITDDTTC